MTLGAGGLSGLKDSHDFLVRFLCFMCEVQDMSPWLPAPATMLRHQP